MGSSGDLQYALPFIMIAVFINFGVVNFDSKKLNYIGYIIVSCYVGIKILLYKELNLDSDLITMHILAFLIINISFIFRRKIWKTKIQDKEQLIWNLNCGKIYGVIMLLCPFYISTSERMYINKVNLMIMFSEYILVGLIYIFMSQFMKKRICISNDK